MAYDPEANEEIDELSQTIVKMAERIGSLQAERTYLLNLIGEIKTIAESSDIHPDIVTQIQQVTEDVNLEEVPEITKEMLRELIKYHRMQIRSGRVGTPNVYVKLATLEREAKERGMIIR